MLRPDQNAYPISAGLHDHFYSLAPEILKHSKNLIDKAINQVREYEHGTADIEAIGVDLTGYAAVLFDFVVSVITE